MMLQDQAKDLQESNAQLEEQARLLEIKNQALEKSKEKLTTYSLKLKEGSGMIYVDLWKRKR